MSVINEHATLSERHLTMLRDESGISNETLDARGCRTVNTKAVLKQRGFSDAQCNVPALLFPVWSVHGEIATYQARPDEPRLKNGKPIKYETPAGARLSVDVPPSVRGWLGDPRRPLFITEGVKKADSAASRGLCCIALLGVWNFRGTNEHGGKTILPDWNHIALNDRTVYIVFDSDVMEKQSVHQALIQLKLFLESRHARVSLIYLPSGDGGAKLGLDDFFVSGKSVDDLLAHASTELRSITASVDTQEREQSESQGQSQAAQLVALGREAELWHTPEGDAFASYTIGTHTETSKLSGKGFRQWLEWRYYTLEKRPPSSQAMLDAVGVLSSVARFDGAERRIFTRLAGHEGTTYLDLCDEEWRIVAISANGWHVIEAKDAPVRFRRAKGMQALPAPEQGGNVRELRRFVNVRDESDLTLLLAWLVAALRGDARNFPVLSLTGEQGSAKSTTARVLRFLIDPNQAALRSEQRNGWDLAIAASNSWCIALDNLSALPLWYSDALCRVSTGGGFATRAHYENDEETIFDATRPILINGIDDIAARADLLDRAIVLHLPTIPEHARKDEGGFWLEFADARPRLLGALCDAVATAQKNLPDVKLERLPRMADFAKWATAAEAALGCAPGAFLQAYNGNRRAANDLALEASPVASALTALMEARGGEPLTITLKELLTKLNDSLDDPKSLPTGWPKDARALSGALARCAPTLRVSGWNITEATREPATGLTRRNIARLDNLCNSSSLSSLPSQSDENKAFSCEDSCEDELTDLRFSSSSSLPSHSPSQQNLNENAKCEDSEDSEDRKQTSSNGMVHQAASCTFSMHDDLAPDWLCDADEVAERAAIMEYDGGLASADAERQAQKREL